MRGWVTEVSLRLHCPQPDFLEVPGTLMGFNTLRAPGRPLLFSSLSLWGEWLLSNGPVCVVPDTRNRMEKNKTPEISSEAPFLSSLQNKGGPHVSKDSIGNGRGNNHRSGSRVHPGPGAGLPLFLIFIPPCVNDVYYAYFTDRKTEAPRSQTRSMYGMEEGYTLSSFRLHGL